jgi:hypothetical protein
VEVATEWDYASGSTDVLICTSALEIVAFEAKLRDWRTALHQAYRNTTFARRAFVVMPSDPATRVASNKLHFEQRGVGLMSFSRKGCEFLIDAERREDPLILPWMHERALAHFAQIARDRDARPRRSSRRDLQAA